MLLPGLLAAGVRTGVSEVEVTWLCLLMFNLTRFDSKSAVPQKNNRPTEHSKASAPWSDNNSQITANFTPLCVYRGKKRMKKNCGRANTSARIIRKRAKIGQFDV